jgi:hypothetical protein
MRLIAMLLMVVVLTGCRGRLAWVDEVSPVSCPGGRVDIERRTTSVVAGQTRNTVTRTNSCLE